MDPVPETRASLIVRLRNAQDKAAWSEFLALYEPLILRQMRKNGLQECDARDACQQVLTAVARDVGQWQADGRTASFRRWLFQIARNRIIKSLSQVRTRARATGGTDAHIRLESHPDPRESPSADFDVECRRQLLAWAAEEVQGEFHQSTWQAFWRTCVDGQPATDVAAQLGTTTGNVYVARSRVIARLREKVREVEDDAM
jgi:RNA polymerase sigma-70 factor (ECF subfamily)